MAGNGKATAKAAANQQKKKQLCRSVSAESSGKKMTAAASTKPPALVAPSPFASTKPPALVAPSPFASTKPPALVAPSPFASTKPPALVTASTIASTNVPALVAPSPVASSKAPVLVAPPPIPVTMTKPPAVAARSSVASSKAPVVVARPPIPVAMTKPPALAARSPVTPSKAPVLVAPSPVAMTKPIPYAKVKPSIAAMMAKHDRDDGGDKRAAGAMEATVAQAEDESKATDHQQQQQYKRLRYSVSPSPVIASTNTPAVVTPSPVASTKTPAVVAPSPVAYSPAVSVTKAPAPSSITSSTKAQSPAPAPAAPSPVAMAKPSSSTVAVKHGPDERTVGATAEDWVNLDVAKKRLHCAVCPSPLEPPIFQCEEGHVVCSACGGDANKHCRACDGRAATYSRFSYMDGLVGDYRAPCPYKKFGCSMSTAYHKAAEHTASCSYAPCYCLEEQCVFEGSPAMLLRHLTAGGGRHRWPVENLNYETVYQFRVEASEHRRLLVAEEDGRVFLLAVGGGGGVRRPVTVVCVRGNPDARPLYKGVLWVDGPPAAAGDIRDESKVSAKVASCAVPGEVDMEQGQLHVHVNPSFLHGESSELHLRLRITKFP